MDLALFRKGCLELLAIRKLQIANIHIVFVDVLSMVSQGREGFMHMFGRLVNTTHEIDKVLEGQRAFAVGRLEKVLIGFIVRMIDVFGLECGLEFTTVQRAAFVLIEVLERFNVRCELLKSYVGDAAGKNLVLHQMHSSWRWAILEGGVQASNR